MFQHSRHYAALVASAMALGYATDGLAERNEAAAPSPTPAELSDAEILGVADAANAGEVDQGKIALAKAQRQTVKSFANRMIADHGVAKDKGRTLAEQLGLTLASSQERLKVEKDDKDVAEQLRAAEEDDFDHTYMQVQVTLHQKILKLLDETLIPQADAQRIEELLTEMRTHVAHHLTLATSTLKQLEAR